MVDKKYNIYELLYAISEANEDEQDALKKYMGLLNILTNTRADTGSQDIFIKDLKNKINEYSSEEMKHSFGLSDAFSKLSGIIAEND